MIEEKCFGCHCTLRYLNFINSLQSLARFILGTYHSSRRIIYKSSINTRDGSSVWDELGQRTVVRVIIRLCINMVRLDKTN